MSQLISPVLAPMLDKLGNDIQYFDIRLAQVCTSAGNTETGDPKTGDGRIWVIGTGNGMPVRAFNAYAYDGMVGHFVFIAEKRRGGATFVKEVAWDENVTKGGNLYAALAASGPQQSPDTMRPRHNYLATTAPTITDDNTLGYSTLSQWINTSTEIIYECRNAATGAAEWERISGNAPKDATYITQTANSELSAEQAIGALGTGILKGTTTTGVITSLGPSAVLAQGDLLYASGADALTKLAKNTSASRYVSNQGSSNNPDWQQVNLANGVTGLLTASGAATEISTTTTGNIDNFAIGTAPITLLRMNNASDATLRGMAAGVGGQVVIIASVGAGNVFLAHQNAGSDAANRLINTVTSADTPLSAGKGTATYVYDDTTDRWRLKTHEQGGYIAYTVTWAGGSPSIGNGSLTGQYRVTGPNIEIRIALVGGSTTNWGGATAWTFSVPIAVIGAGANFIGGYALDANVVIYFLTNMRFPSTTTVSAFSQNTITYNSTTPFTWNGTDADTLEVAGFYRAA